MYNHTVRVGIGDLKPDVVTGKSVILTESDFLESVKAAFSKARIVFYQAKDQTIQIISSVYLAKVTEQKIYFFQREMLRREYMSKKHKLKGQFVKRNQEHAIGDFVQSESGVIICVIGADASVTTVLEQVKVCYSGCVCNVTDRQIVKTKVIRHALLNVSKFEVGDRRIKKNKRTLLINWIIQYLSVYCGMKGTTYQPYRVKPYHWLWEIVNGDLTESDPTILIHINNGYKEVVHGGLLIAWYGDQFPNHKVQLHYSDYSNSYATVIGKAESVLDTVAYEYLFNTAKVTTLTPSNNFKSSKV